MYFTPPLKSVPMCGPTFSQLLSFKTHCETFLNYLKLADILILRLSICDKGGRASCRLGTGADAKIKISPTYIESFLTSFLFTLANFIKQYGRWARVEQKALIRGC